MNKSFNDNDVAMKMKTKSSPSPFWLNNPAILFDSEKITDVWPSAHMTFTEKLNAVSRLVIMLCLAGYILTMSVKILFSGVITLGVLVFLYYVKRDEAEREGFLDAFNYVDPTNLLLKKMTPAMFEADREEDNPLKNENYYKLTSKNPLGNVLLPEIGDNPERKPAPPTFNHDVEYVVNKTAQEMTQEQHPSISNLDKRLFQDLGDKFEFENSMIQFNSMPSTTIPNAQGAFAEFCYGNMKSCKDIRTPGACGNDPPRVGSILG